MSAIIDELALFAPGVKESAVNECDWINFRPVGQISKGSAIEFQIPGTSSEYILLSKTRLHLKVRILRPDGNPIDTTDEVALTNLSLHSLIRQADISLNQTIINSNVGVNYGFKSLLDVTLNYSHDSKNSLLQTEGFYKDEAGYFEDVSSNTGYIQRKRLTEYGIVDFEGVLHVDITQQPKAILNGVQIGVTLFQSDDDFRLFTLSGIKYEVEVTEAVLKVCHVRVNPVVMLSHNQRLLKSPAIYSY